MKHHILIMLYFFLGAVFITFPLIFHMSDYTFGYGDEALIAWIMNWNIHALLTDPFSLFNAPLYYPYTNTLAYSDLFFTSSFIALIPTLISNQPMIPYNVNVFVSLTTLGYFTYLLVKHITKDMYAGVVAGTLVAFSTFTLQRLPHLQVISVQWIPLCLLFLYLFVKQKRFVFLVLANAAFLLQVANSPQTGYFALFAAVTLIIVKIFNNKRLVKSVNIKKLAGLLLINAVILTALSYPYFQVSKQFGYVRDIRETINFANRPEFILYPNDNTRLQSVLKSTFYATESKLTYDGYLGGVLFLLSVTTFIVFVYRRKKYRNTELGFFIFLSIGSFVLSLGPALQWGGRVIKEPFIIPLPYAVLYYLVPGFKGIRNSGRWEMLAIFALSVTVGIMLAILWKKRSNVARVFLTVCLCGLVFAEFSFPRELHAIETFAEFPPVYHFTKQLPGNAAVIELPYYNWSMSPYSILENRRAYYSTLHFRPRVNGGSGFSPPEWQERTLDFIFKFPDKKTLGYLKSIHVTHIIMHKREYDVMKKDNYKVNGKTVKFWEDIQTDIAKSSEIRFVKQFDSDYVYEIIYK